jgi:cytochrome b561
MRLRDSSAGWGWMTRVLHWSMAALILLQLGFGAYIVQVVRDDLLTRFALTQLHKSWGFVVFVLALIRVAWRALNPSRPPLPPMPAWQARAARLSHRLLYVLMFLMPLSGWVMASASPTQDLLQMQNMVFETFALPDPFVPGVASVETAAWWVHTVAAAVLALVLAVHAAAALRHQFVDRDHLLARMLWRT